MAKNAKGATKIKTAIENEMVSKETFMWNERDVIEQMAV